MSNTVLNSNLVSDHNDTIEIGFKYYDGKYDKETDVYSVKLTDRFRAALSSNQTYGEWSPGKPLPSLPRTCYSISLANMFKSMSDLETLDLSLWDTSYVLDIHSLFHYCKHLKSVKGLNTWDTCEFTNMASVFSDCKELETLDLTGWKVDRVVTFDYMFKGCVSLKEIKGIECWCITELTSASDMFYDCVSLKELKLDWGKASQLKSMNNFFEECSSLESAEINMSETNNLENINSLFSGCNNLKSITGLDTWDVSKVSDATNLFAGCTNLDEVKDVTVWNLPPDADITNMFKGVGGNLLPNWYRSLVGLPVLSDNVENPYGEKSKCANLKNDYFVCVYGPNEFGHIIVEMSNELKNAINTKGSYKKYIYGESLPKPPMIKGFKYMGNYVYFKKY